MISSRFKSGTPISFFFKGKPKCELDSLKKERVKLSVSFKLQPLCKRLFCWNLVRWLDGLFLDGFSYEKLGRFELKKSVYVEFYTDKLYRDS